MKNTSSRVHSTRHIFIRKGILLAFLSFCLQISVVAQSSAPLREFRATWLTTVANIDWPKSQTMQNQQSELLQMLDSIQTFNFNVVLFQVRPCCDAFYESAYEPWSSYMYRNRGTYPGFDPLAFVLEECHKRGIACHAWLNPYRYSDRNGNDWIAGNDNALNYTHTHPEWLLHFSSSIILDPGLPEVRQRIKDVVGDILSKYDVDGIIFDDYFYPYGGTTNQDTISQRLYRPSNMAVGDWRRDNVRKMVEDVYDTIQAVKPWVTFGISPFGIWTTDYSVANREGITLPSGIYGGNMYQEIYCDPVAWLKDGTVDYLSPQLYWRIGGNQDYNKLCPWWANLCNKFRTHFYSSMALYKYAENSDSYYTIDEIKNQTLKNRTASKDGAFGPVYYNTRAWVFDRKMRRNLRSEILAKPALQPAINWKKTAVQPMVENIALSGQELTWTHTAAGNVPVRFAVYAVPAVHRDWAHVFTQAENLLGITYSQSYTLPEGISTSTHKIAVSVLDGFNNEYSLRVLGEETLPSTPCSLAYPAADATTNWKNFFRWEAVADAQSYEWQIATDPQFEHILAAQEVTKHYFDPSLRLNLTENGEYYWRVRVRKANMTDAWSEPRRVVVNKAYTGKDDEFYDGVENAEINIQVRRQGDELIVSTPVADDIFVYDILGHMLYSGRYEAVNGEMRITLPATGMVIVRIGNYNTKL